MKKSKEYVAAAQEMKKWKRVVWGLLLLIIWVVTPYTIVDAATIDFQQQVTQLQAKFPHEKYWNHVGMNADNSDGYTEKPCALHSKSGIHITGNGGCTCNHFAGGGHVSATQCMGFANKLAYDVFGNTTWKTVSSPTAEQLADIRIGDIVRLDYNSHSVFVIARTGSKIMVGEANYPKNCQISWGRIIDLSTANVTYYERAANYDTVIGNQSSEVTEADGSTTEQETTSDETGWKKASDGVHYQYYQLGKLQKKKWITIQKKKYYVDKKGYRVTGFYDIKNDTYYFNSKGVLQKNKWFTRNGETYYVNRDGIVLKSQWLYYKNTLVYVTEDGSIAKSEMVKIGSKLYYFNSNGKRSKGFKEYKGNYYYTNSNGVIQKKKWITKGGKKYYLQKNGVRAQSKLLKIGKYRYYFNRKGQMVKNKHITYKEKIYKVDKKGHCKYVGEVVTTEQETTEQRTTENATEEMVTEITGD